MFDPLPFRCEFDSSPPTITVDGLTISLEFLKIVANPNPQAYYRMVRNGTELTVTEFRRSGNEIFSE